MRSHVQLVDEGINLRIFDSDGEDYISRCRGLLSAPQKTSIDPALRLDNSMIYFQRTLLTDKSHRYNGCENPAMQRVKRWIGDNTLKAFESAITTARCPYFATFKAWKPRYIFASRCDLGCSRVQWCIKMRVGMLMGMMMDESRWRRSWRDPDKGAWQRAMGAYGCDSGFEEQEDKVTQNE